MSTLPAEHILGPPKKKKVGNLVKMTQTLTWSKSYLVHSLIKKYYAVHLCTFVLLH